MLSRTVDIQKLYSEVQISRVSRAFVPVRRTRVESGLLHAERQAELTRLIRLRPVARLEDLYLPEQESDPTWPPDGRKAMDALLELLQGTLRHDALGVTSIGGVREASIDIISREGTALVDHLLEAS